MTYLETIDNHTGKLAGLLPPLDALISQARNKKDYKSCVELCAGTRSAFMTVHHQCTLYPHLTEEDISAFKLPFQSAIQILEGVSRDKFKESERDHLVGMIQNIKHRVKMVEVLAQTDRAIEDRVTEIDALATEMVKEQKKLLSTQGRDR